MLRGTRGFTAVAQRLNFGSSNIRTDSFLSLVWVETVLSARLDSLTAEDGCSTERIAIKLATDLFGLLRF